MRQAGLRVFSGVRAAPKGNRALESAIQLAICDYLAIRRHFFWRQNTVGLYDREKESFRSMPKYGKRGVADILLVKDSVLWGLEVKQKGGRQSEHQKQFEKELIEAGGRYHIVTSIEDVQALGL